MLQGLITSLLIKLTIEYWYFTLIAILIKLFMLRFTVADSWSRAFLMLLVGSITFFVVACLTGIVFSSARFDVIPVIMFFVGCGFDLLFSAVMFRTEPRKLIPEILISNGIFFGLLFPQML